MSKCKYEGSGVWKGRCVGTKEIDPCPGHDKCDRFKPNYKTNADHIRSMTDEELNKVFWGRDLCNVVEYYDFEWCRNRASCKNCGIEWLKQPYKEGT